MTTGTTRSQLSDFWDRRAFSVADIEFFWLDVAMAAMARGEWAAFERRLAEGLACMARAAADDAWPSDEVIEEAGDAFRYERDLIAGSDMTAWLESAGLSTTDWTLFLKRDALRRTWAENLDDILERFAPSPRQFESAAVAEGICSGMFDAFERSFSGRVAAVCEIDPDLLDRAPKPHSASEAPATRLARQHAHWFSMREGAETRARLETVVHLQESFDGLSERLFSTERLHDLVEENRLAWISVELDTISFPTEDAAREAVWCVKEDGLSVHDVAGLSRRPVRRTRQLLADVSQNHREHLVSTEPGRVLGPLAVDGGFDVIAVVGRTLPTLHDPQVAARARQTAVESAMRRAARDRVKRS